MLFSFQAIWLYHQYAYTTSILESHISLKQPQRQFFSSPGKRPFFNLREIMVQNRFQNWAGKTGGYE